MELQWPLILFTTFISASAGLFAALDAMRSQSAAKCSGVLALASSELSALTTICYAIAMSTRENTFVSVGYTTIQPIRRTRSSMPPTIRHSPAGRCR